MITNEQIYIKSVAIYCRLSKDDGSISDSSSIKSQCELLTNFANQHKWNIYDIYIDDGYSGTNFERPGFEKMCKDIEKGRINIVIAKDLSRLGRNYIKTGQLIDEYFPNHNVRFIAISDNIDTNKSDDMSLDFAPFKNVINEWYARDTSKKIRSVLKMKKQKGTIIKTPVPLYGYKYGEKNTIEINEDTAYIIKYIFKEYARGTPTSVIKQYLFDNKIYTPGYYAYKKYGYNPTFYEQYSEEKKYTWKTCVIDRLITNEEYTGLFIASKTSTINFKNHRRKKVDTTEYTFDGKRPQIISKEIYDLAIKRKKLTYRPRKKEDDLAPLQGLLYCADCGRLMNYKTLNNVKGKYHQEFYACRAKDCKTIAYISSKAMHLIVTEIISSLKEYLIEKEELLYEYARIYVSKKKTKEDENAIKKRIESLKEELKECEIKIMRLFDDHNSNKIPTAVYEKYSKEYTLEYEEKNNKINILSKPQIMKTKINYLEQAKKFIEELKMFNNYSDKKLLNILFDKILISKNFIYGENNRTHYEVTVKFIFAFNDNFLEKFIKNI